MVWGRGLPSYGIDGPPHEVDRGLRPVLLGEFAYCPKCGEWTFLGGPGEGSLCGHEVERVSGSLLRGVLLEGLRPPSVVMRPEVHDVVVRWRMWGHPFVTCCYPK
jgi:sulfate adenylyltransferase